MFYLFSKLLDCAVSFHRYLHVFLLWLSRIKTWQTRAISDENYTVSQKIAVGNQRLYFCCDISPGIGTPSTIV